MDMNGAAGMVFLDGNHVEPSKPRKYIEHVFIIYIFDTELAIWNDTSSLTNKNERPHFVQKSNFIKLVCFSSSGPGWLYCYVWLVAQGRHCL